MFDMMEFHDIVAACREAGIEPQDLDRVLLSRESYEELREKPPETQTMNTSDHKTLDGPSIRVTDGDERLVYVNEKGYEVVIEL